MLIIVCGLQGTEKIIITRGFAEKQIYSEIKNNKEK